MDDQELLDFDLDDIIKEFSDTPTQSPEEEPAAEEVQPEAAPSVVTGDTIRLEKIPVASVEVRNAQHIDDEEEEAPIYVPAQKTEPYSNEWEPEYEQPMGEYIPPKPIVFHPRSRLRELKRKLVAGPERLYYALSEKGLGKLQALIFLSLLVAVISAVATALYAFGFVPENRMRLMVFGQFFAMLVAALLGSYQLIEGVTDLLRKRFSLNTLLVFTFILCCVDAVLCLQQLRVPCCAAFSLQVTMSLWSTYQRRNAKLGQLDTMRKAVRLDRITPVEDYMDGVKGLLRGEGQVEDFMTTYDKPSKLHKVLSVYAIVALCVSVAVGILGGILHGVGTGVQVAAVTTLAALPASMFVAISRPMAVLETRLHKLGTVLCGWEGVEALSGKAVFPLDHADLFPVSSVRMNGVKFFGSREPDEIIAAATALVEADGGGLAPLFTQLLDSRNGMHYDVEQFCTYENGGIGGVVNGEPILAGTLHFLKEMGVEVPEGIRVSQAVCVAINSQLCGLFAISYEKQREATAGIGTLTSYRGLQAVLTTPDFMITEGFVRNKFGIKTKRILFPDVAVREQLRQKTLEPDTGAAALITGEGLAPFAYAVTGARTVKAASTAGVVVHMVGGILGIVMMLVLAIIGATALLTPANMFLYELVWMIPGLLITEWTRSI